LMLAEPKSAAISNTGQNNKQ